MRVPRQDFLNALEAVEPGLARREIVEHSTSFVFLKGYVATFNQELYCKAKSPLGNKVEGAVQARPLLGILRKLPEDEVEVTLEEGRLIVKGKNKRARIKMDAEILLPLDKIEKPGEWSKLHKDFPLALEMVCECASKDEEYVHLTCVHMTPKFIEAFDGHQVIRYHVKTGINGSVLIRSDYIKHTIQLGMTEFSETKNWIHFRNKQGYRLTCRLFREDYKDLTALFEVKKASPASLPEGLVEAAERANEASKENADDNVVTVRIKDGKIQVTGEGQSMDYMEAKKINYDGPDVKFLIAPKLLIELTQNYKDCEIGEGKLRVNGGKFVYCACLSPVGEE